MAEECRAWSTTAVPLGGERRLAPAQETDFGLYHSQAPGRRAPWREVKFVSGCGSGEPTLPLPIREIR